MEPPDTVTPGGTTAGFTDAASNVRGFWAKIIARSTK